MTKKLKVACLQVSAREYNDRFENKENILRMIDRAADSHPQLMVLPECVYPAYYISPLIVKNSFEFQKSTLELIAEVKKRAQLYKCIIAIGVVETDPDKNIYYNSALLINPEGQEIGHFRKSYLWHFDSNWFCAGDEYPIIETEFGKIGMFICADGRLPEIARCLTLQGADILLDLTNWVTSGFETERLTNPQVDYMIPTRALENRVWIIAANKVGMEAKSILYCGKSAIFSPDGQIVKMVSPDQEETLFYEISLEGILDKFIDKQINVINDRRPELYAELIQPTDTLPIYSMMKKKTTPKNPIPLTAVVQIELEDNFKKYLQKIKFFINNLLEQETDIIIFPECNFNFPEKGEEIIHEIKQTTEDRKALCVITIVEKTDKSYYKTTYLIESGTLRGKYRKTHLEREEKMLFTPGDLGLPVFKTTYGNMGVMIGYEGIFPEIARTLTLKGADIIIWPSKFSNDRQINICRSRGAENKIFLACSNAISHQSTGHSLITSPSGQILTSCLGKAEQASLSSLHLMLSRNKDIVPHTNTILDRKPDTYKILLNKFHLKEK
ncbi:MAG TPA: carbon-nitrogen hydrolase family protein [Candidatus Atribacteria bacterium]|nr:carbon-nitrogen hydrolase family protein [Candidatus Atribacteria bacterium]